ncbi:MAG: PilZ domain-containing protein [Acidobacteriota bacterium]
MTRKTVLWSETIRSRVESGPAHFLRRSSIRTISAGTGSVLIDIALTDRPDLIVLSDDLTELPAIEVCRRLRADDRTRMIRILVLPRRDDGELFLREPGSTELLDAAIAPDALQRRITAELGMRLRRHPRYPVVLPVARGRFFREFLGYSNSMSEAGMGFETLARIRQDEILPLRIYRNTEEKPIQVTARVRAVRPNIDTGAGYAVGVEFQHIRSADRARLLELFPADPGVIWGPDPPSEPGPGGSRSRGAAARDEIP